jgi:hypothetical protein
MFCEPSHAGLDYKMLKVKYSPESSLQTSSLQRTQLVHVQELTVPFIFGKQNPTLEMTRDLVEDCDNLANSLRTCWGLFTCLDGVEACMYGFGSIVMFCFDPFFGVYRMPPRYR